MKKAKKRKRSRAATFFIFLLLIATGAFMALPLVYAVMSAFKPLEELFLYPPRFFVRRPNLYNFRLMGQLLSSFWVIIDRYVFNTVFVTVAATGGHVLFASMAAYAIAKHEFRGKKLLNSMITLSLLFTGGVTGLAQYVVMARLGIIDTYWALILPGIQSSLGLFLCIQYLDTLPVSILESARLDGAGEFAIYRKIVVPNITPAIVTILIFEFQAAWNSTGQGFIYSEQMKMLPTALSQIATAGIARAGVGSAAALVLMIPPILVFVLMQSKIMETMAYSGVKE